MVIFFHLLNNSYFNTDPNQLNRIEKTIMRLTSLGWSGVNLFFILSGFLIGSILLKNRKSDTFFRTFYVRRFFRIVPAYYLLLFLFILLKFTPLFNPNAYIFEKPIPVLFYFGFLQNFAMSFLGHFGPEALTPTWSLAVEEQFYLIIPLIVYFIRPRLLPYIIGFFLVLGPVTRYFTTNWYAEYTLLPSRIDNPVMGFLLAYLYSQSSFREYVRANIKIIKATALLLIFICAVIYSFTQVGFLNQSILGVIYALLVLIVLETNKGWLYAILTSRVLVRWGLYSYFIYLFHLMLNGIFQLAFLHHEKPVLGNYQDYLVSLASLILTYLLAALSFRYIESPLVRFSHSFRYKKNVQ